MRGLRIVANRHKQGNYIWLCCICVANKDQITCMSCYVVYPVYSACQAVSCFRNWDLYRYHCLLETSHSSSKVGKFMSNATPQTNRSFCYISMESIASSILVFLFTATKSSIALPSVYLGPAGRLPRYPKKTWIQRLRKREQNLFIYFDHIRIVTMLSRWSLWHPLSHLLS